VNPEMLTKRWHRLINWVLKAMKAAETAKAKVRDPKAVMPLEG
jgi:hypothetical protein